ncbi:hypothetical protein GNE08_02840 [Trichormus variabilis ARAD]|uniref:Uncharacterized protein n=1 Tax=Trichormus variabilis N2B TaxID=2681315 RepID=A0ABR6S5R3_ANAVA|nr:MULTISPECIES: hypothetical protein [Nostocaceae]MBC1213159.1 hypothetical protein [Trichormus variabilis ARAD]MBC1253968.1 hypothetical protein [Trichormus variabilis V5]MBC1265589.1 hypothetical protein [Trichormus variabilis FSR]MBC1301740.1 hypothetical protein [Trichormus variabilis N2B]MBC1310164.1 hypothetical protein [Trichormus variabilis PNB]
MKKTVHLIPHPAQVYILQLDIYDPQSSEKELFKGANLSIRECLKSYEMYDFMPNVVP